MLSSLTCEDMRCNPALTRPSSLLLAVCQAIHMHAFRPAHGLAWDALTAARA